MKLVTRKLTHRRVLGSAAAALLCTGVLATGILDTADRSLQDALYQRASVPGGQVLVVGVTSEDLENFGPWPWNRSIMADVLNELNADETARPAVIGVDTLYVSEMDAEADAALAQAAAAGNVVVACSAEYSTELEYDATDNSYSMNDLAIQTYALPFPALAEAAGYGHVNAMYDSDGILRHHLWSIPSPEGEELLSLPWQLYSRYCAAHGTQATFDPPRTGRGFWYVDYTAEPGDFLDYSVTDILNGNFDPDRLADAIVLIGPYDPGLSDSFITAIDHAQKMYGVEYLANVTQAMLDGRAVREAGKLWQLVATALALFGLCLLYVTLAPAFGLALALLQPALPLALLAYRGGLLLRPLWLPAASAACYIGALIFHYVMVNRERQHVRSTFGRYVDPHILQDLMRENSDSLGLQGKSCEIAVLFVDIRGFTSMSEGMTPEQVVAILNEYLTLTSDCVRRNGGTLDKYVGDCTMAFWGAPLPCADPIYQACRAAMDMVEGAMALGERLREVYGHEVGFGVGVHYGPAVVGNIGSQFRMDYTAIGDTVNTASRLESNAPRGTVYISRVVVDALGDCADVTKTGPIKLKGKSEGFEIFTLDALRPRRKPGKRAEETE